MYAREHSAVTPLVIDAVVERAPQHLAFGLETHERGFDRGLIECEGLGQTGRRRRSDGLHPAPYDLRDRRFRSGWLRVARPPVCDVENLKTLGGDPKRRIV